MIDVLEVFIVSGNIDKIEIVHSQQMKSVVGKHAEAVHSGEMFQ